MKKKFLSAATILQAPDLKVVEEAVPEWPGEDGEPGVIRLRRLTALDSTRMSTLTIRIENKDLGMYIVIVFCAVDAQNQRLFPIPDGDVEAPEFKEAMATHIASLQQKNMKVLNRLQRICLDLNSLSDVKKAEIKNDSGEATTNASPTV